MRLKDLADSTSDLFNLPVDVLDIDPGYNVRLDTPELAQHVAALADSIASVGFLQSKPLIVRLVGERAVIVDGHCRFAAVRLAMARGVEIKRLPCLSEPRGTDDRDRALMLLTANSGLPLSPLEQAAVVKRLLALGWSEPEIAGKIGRTRQHVANLLDLAAAPEPVRDMVRRGGVSATEAVRLVRKEGAGAVAALERASDAARACGREKVTGRTLRASGAAPAGAVAQYAELRDAVRALLVAWDDTGAGKPVRAIARLRELVA